MGLYSASQLSENTWLDTGREKVMAIITPACQFLYYENMILGENTWLDTGTEKVMAIITPACQFNGYVYMHLCDNTLQCVVIGIVSDT